MAPTGPQVTKPLGTQVPIIAQVEQPIATPDPNDARFSKIEGALEKITGVLANLAQNLPVQKVEQPKITTPVQVEAMKAKVKRMDVPEEWRAIVDEYLGVDFITSLQASSGGNFSMLVEFPKHIDRRIGTQRDSVNPDCSMFSPIRLASTLDDVKKWCELTVQNIKSLEQYKKFTPKQEA